MMGFGLPNQEETHRREFESPPGYHTPRSNIPAPDSLAGDSVDDGNVGQASEADHGIITSWPSSPCRDHLRGSSDSCLPGWTRECYRWNLVDPYSPSRQRRRHAEELRGKPAIPVEAASVCSGDDARCVG